MILISRKKILRDIIIIVIIVIAGVLAWNHFRSSGAGKPFEHPMMNPSGNAGTMKGDGSAFNTEDNTPALMIQDQTFTIGQIDSQGKIYFSMMSRGEMGLTEEIRNEARKMAIQQIKEEIVLRNQASERGIEITPELVESELKSRFEEMGGEQPFYDMMKTFGVSRDNMLKRTEKDLLQNAVFEAVTSEIKVPEGENPDVFKSVEFEKWIKGQVAELKVKALLPEMETIISMDQAQPDETLSKPTQDDYSLKKEDG